MDEPPNEGMKRSKGGWFWGVHGRWVEPRF